MPIVMHGLTEAKGFGHHGLLACLVAAACVYGAFAAHGQSNEVSMNTRVAVVIPALNEAATIQKVVSGCLAALGEPPYNAMVIVVDDGSSDDTALRGQESGAQVIGHRTNLGVGRALRTGLDHALASGADIIVNIDADGQFNPGDIPALIAPLVDGQADFASASRFKDPALVPQMPWVKLLGNHLMSRIVSAIVGHKFYDVSCGFRAYNREAALRLNLWGEYTYTQESFLDLCIKGMRIKEVPLRIRGEREHGKSRVASNLFKYAFKTLKIILHTYRAFWPMHFFGWLSLFLLMPGVLLVGFLLTHRLITGSFSPHIWAGFAGGGLFAFGSIILVTGLLGETVKRIRLNQESLLYYERKRQYE